MNHNPLYVGVDLGTSGCRVMAINRELQPVADGKAPLAAPRRQGNTCEQDAEAWWVAVCDAMDDLTEHIDPGSIHAIAVDGTSGSIVMTDDQGIPVSPGLLYNDARALEEADRIAQVAPATSAAHGASSGLAKLLFLQTHSNNRYARHVLNQAEWVAARLVGVYGIGDENNCLKLGYDILNRKWPAWLDMLQIKQEWLPRVVAPGTPLGTVNKSIARRFGLAPHCRVVAGTTDSIAGFLATGANRVGEAVTSLGSTLAIKILSRQPVFAPDSGIYSHRLGEWWLTGGASNSGGAVLRHFFDQTQLDELTAQLDPDHPTGLDYYPLLVPGERFPICDPQLAPRLAPRPDQPLQFFQGMLEGIARIEAAAYRRLAELGAPYPLSVRTVGGGAVNDAWTRIRAHELNVPLIVPKYTEAAYGAALLAAGVHPS